ncbi:DUF4873 domain-containing protein [Nocardiopsis kunsanensis]|uniref:DUF4873 domain-containing protein n=1 Tax=Nocardiopsis kunsanensis TaxID=141693 RepID=A0A919CGC6_9ACTN|nr:DUF4873 domain-containing protein [Nocardiopsis kunsanensis]GHD21130.1 hypothetical protein GCM10007147_14210 [Nocardiopsis kunsanensis]
MSGFDDGEEEYRGVVTVLLSGGEQEGTADVRAHIAGHFSPHTGDYRWKGRLSASDEITAAYENGVREVVVRTPEGHEGTGTLDAPNLWGGHPVSGAGTPPFAVPEVELDD